jgi:hypothetical protein
MVTRNLDKVARLVNGQRGTVVGFDLAKSICAIR